MRHVFLLIFSLMASIANAVDSWPEFRGPGGQGHAVSPDAPLNWSESENIAWKTPIPGRAWSSPVVSGDQIWMTTAVERMGTDAERAAVAIGEHVQHLEMSVVAAVSFRAICVDRKNGEIIHDIELFHEEKPVPIHSLNSYASPTPIIDDGHVYCHFGAFGTACLDASTGDILWRTTFPIAHYVGPGSSPVVCGDVLVLTCDGADAQFVVGVNKFTGDVVWKTDRPPITAENGDFRKSFGTPLLIHVPDKGDQLVAPGAQWIVAYDPKTGKELWRLDHGRGFSIAPRPVFDGERVYFCTGYGDKQICAMRPDGDGELSQSHFVWKDRKQAPTMPSPLVVDDRLYMISDGGVATCFDAATGNAEWRKRIPGEYSASLLFAAGRIYAFSREGVTTVFSPSATYHELAKNTLDGRIMATPAVVDGAMYLRTATHLYRIEE